MDIIKRLNDNELYIDAIDDAIVEIDKLRNENAALKEHNLKLVAACEALHEEVQQVLLENPGSNWLYDVLEQADAAIADAEGDE